MIFVISIILLSFIITKLLATALDCKHDFVNPVRLTVGEWYEHEHTVPQLRGEKILVYRRDVVFSCRCRKCGVLTKQTGHDTKPHESDRMVADLKAHGVDENWKPEPAPWKNETNVFSTPECPLNYCDSPTGECKKNGKCHYAK